MNDHATKRKIIEVTNAEEPANSKKPKIESKEVDESESPDRSANFSSLPLEILSQHILRFFDFREWLEFVIVCKQWQLAAQQSHLPKQLVYVNPGNLEATCTILRKYNVNTLVIVQKTGRTLFSELRTLINSSPSITTLVLDQCYAFHNDTYSNMNQIKTLSTKTTWILPFFPNVEKFKLSKQVHSFFTSNGALFDLDSEIPQSPSTRFPNVKEIEIDALPTVDVDFADIVKYFPNVDKMYVNYGLKGNKQEVEEDWKELEEIGEALGVQIICRNPHLSERADVFSLTSITYHEYFNAFGETPLQKFLSYNRTEKCQELFLSYSSRQYKKDLFHREPQFTFPLRGPKFRPVGMMAYIGTLSDQTMVAMVECGYINYWKALRGLKPECAVDYLNSANQFLPPTTSAVESIAKLIDQRLNTTDIANIIGLETFKEIAQLTSRHGSTLLHKLASKTSRRSDDLDLIIQHSDVNALNKDGMNAATIAFNHNQFTSWLKLVNAGSQVQTKFYGNKSSLGFLKELLTSDNYNSFFKVLHQLDQPYLQKLMRLLATPDATDHFFPTTNSEATLEDLISLGAQPNDCDDDQDPLISLMAESEQIELFWPIIERYQLDIDAPNREGYTPLMISIQHGFIDQAELLLEERADPNTNGTSQDGKVRHTVFLEQAVCHPGHCIDLLQKYGAYWTVEDEQGNTVLNYAMLHYNNVCIKSLAKLVPIDKPNHNNCTPLFNAICQHKSGFVNDLIEAGADVNALAGPLLQTALMTAIESSLEEILLVLLKKDKNMDITTRDRVGRSIIHYLLLTHDIRLLAEVLQSNYLQEDDIESLVHKFSSPENIIFVKNELATIFANPDLQYLKTNFLNIAITNVIITRTVVDMLGVDVNMEDSNGNTMLHLLNVDRPEAAVETPEEVVDYLLSKPSLNLNHQNKQKNTPLMTMTEKKKTDIDFESWQLMLINEGASLTIKNMWGLSPIDIEPSLKQYVK